jgi:hypothetical protein
MEVFLVNYHHDLCGQYKHKYIYINEYFISKLMK